MTFVAPTDKMWKFMLGLAAERAYLALGSCADERLAALEAHREHHTLDKWQAMELIDWLKAAPRDVEAADAGAALQPGVYRRNGELFVVKLNRAGTSLYAKRLVDAPGRRLTEAGDVVKAELVYAPGAVRELRPADHLTLEQAEEYLVRYSNCLVCGRNLRDANSVRRSIGPVCVRMFREAKPEPTSVDLTQEGRLSDLLTQLQES